MSLPGSTTDVRSLSGELESPRAGDVLRSADLHVRGWLRGESAPVRTLVLKRRGAADVIVRHGLGSGRCGFDSTVALSPHPSGPLELELWADLENGERVRAFSVKVVGAAPASPRPSAIHFLGSAARKALGALRERRLPLSPALWLRQLEEHWSELTERGSTSAPRPLMEAKEELARTAAAELVRFLSSGARLAIPTSDDPAVSILVVAHNRAELLLRCLRALAAACSVPFELVIVDNGSVDQTGELLHRLDGAQLIRAAENLGFPAAVNQAARLARGRSLLLLNHDAEPQPGSVDAALDALREDVGAVGARLVLADGRLQEAGSIIWRDGSCTGYGRGDNADAPPYTFQRDVDFCSGAFLLTPRALFAELGGLDEGYGPAYYEEVDYCVRLWKQGRRVVYAPNAVVAHFEFASTPTSAAAQRMQAERRARFYERHRDWLHAQRDDRDLLRARARRGAGLRVLVIDDRVPHAHLGSGWPRARALIQALVEAGHDVTLFPTVQRHEDWPSVRASLGGRVEVMLDAGAAGLGRFLDEREGFYDRIIVSRPNNLRTLRARRRRRWPPPGLIYDAEALFAERSAASRALRGTGPTEEEKERLCQEEIDLARGARVVLAVTDEERRRFQRIAPTVTLGHALDLAPTSLPFEERLGILFVGAFYTDDSPNTDGVLWLAREILPRLRRRLGDVRLTIAGAQPPPSVRALAGADIDVFDGLADLTPLYDRARVFLAPTRFAAGLPFKIHHAAAHGVPVVGTSLLARQLGWRHRQELLVADSPLDLAAQTAELYRDGELWRALRAAALARVERDCSPRAFAASLREALR